jgi:pimeloyl-ACP methyl ester carboxylesterase
MFHTLSLADLILSGALLLVLLLLLGNLFTTYLQHLFIFRPRRLPADYAFQFSGNFEEVWLQTPGNGNIHGLWFKAPNAKGVVLYFHGNAGSLKRWGHYHAFFRQHNYDYFCIDYRGFGKSRGPKNEPNMYADADAAYTFVRQHYPPEHITLYGRSLGSTFACYLAARHAVRQLILETPFSSMKDLFYAYFPFLPKWFRFRFRFFNVENLRRTSSPVTIFHGDSDFVVPLAVARRLEPALKNTDQFILIKGAGHSNLLYFDRYLRTMSKLLRS